MWAMVSAGRAESPEYTCGQQHHAARLGGGLSVAAKLAARAGQVEVGKAGAAECLRHGCIVARVADDPGFLQSASSANVCFAKTLHACRINELEARLCSALFAMIP